MSHLRIIGKDERPPQPQFNGKRLAQARELKRFSVEDLAEALGVLPLEIRCYESAFQQPQEAMVEELAIRLDFPTAFFFREDPPEFGPSTLDWHTRVKKPK